MKRSSRSANGTTGGCVTYNSKIYNFQLDHLKMWQDKKVGGIQVNIFTYSRTIRC